MISDKATPLVIDIAKEFIMLAQRIEPRWEKAYLRLLCHDSTAETKASYAHSTGVELINVLNHKDFFHSVTQRGKDLLAALGKEKGLFFDN